MSKLWGKKKAAVEGIFGKGDFDKFLHYFEPAGGEKGLRKKQNNEKGPIQREHVVGKRKYQEKGWEKVWTQSDSISYFWCLLSFREEGERPEGKKVEKKKGGGVPLIRHGSKGGKGKVNSRGKSRLSIY